MTCAFCTIPEIKMREIIGDKFAWAFPTNIPIVPGHILISPRRCVAEYESLTRDEKQSIEQIRLRIMEAYKKLYDASGFNFAWNDGKAGGQTVPHFHLHLLPRRTNDVEALDYEPRSFLYGRVPSRESQPESELVKIAERIRSQCA